MAKRRKAFGFFFFSNQGCLFLKCAQTMADRFVLLTDTDVEKFIDIEENRNTERKTEGDLSLVMAFLAREKENRKIEDLPPAELDTYLSRFLLTERKKSGEEYKPATLKGIISSVERYLKKRGYSDSIITGQPFAKTLDALKSKQKQLKWLGKGNKQKDAASFDQEEIDLLFRESWEFIRLKHSLTRCGSTTVYTST